MATRTLSPQILPFSLAPVGRERRGGLLRHAPGFQGKTLLAELFAGLLQQVGELHRVAVDRARQLSATEQAGAGAVNHAQAKVAGAILGSPGDTLERFKGAVGN